MNHHFENDIRAIWIHKLRTEFWRADRLVQKTGKNLQMPEFELTDAAPSRWGQWNQETRTISISLNLLRNYPWSAVTYILRHEIAHQVVSEIYLLEDVNPHGEAFRRACDLLHIPYSRCSSSTLLAGMGYTKDDAIMRKVKKLLALGESPCQEEAERAVAKAHELMVKYNLRPAPSREAWVARPVGRAWKRMPTYVHEITGLLRDYYFVQTIRWNTWDNIEGINLASGDCYCRSENTIKYMQLFGKPENLDIAEYVFHFLLEEGERRWAEYRKTEEYKTAYRTPIKANFINGLMRGYRRKIDKQNRTVKQTLNEQQTTLIRKGDSLLLEMFKRRFPNQATLHTNWNCTRGFGAGLEQGKSISINPGVNGGAKGKLLNS